MLLLITSHASEVMSRGDRTFIFLKFLLNLTLIKGGSFAPTYNPPLMHTLVLCSLTVGRWSD